MPAFSIIKRIAYEHASSIGMALATRRYMVRMHPVHLSKGLSLVI
jgi:hypothetical protein